MTEGYTGLPVAAAAGVEGRFSRRWSIFWWAVLFLLVTLSMQFAIPFPLDADTDYHIAVGRLIREHGILHAFPWTPFSWLADHYADKELLFHLFFAATAHLNWVLAARVVGALLGALLLLVIYLLLWREGVRHAGIWTLIPLAASNSFMYRFALVRPHLLSISLALVVLWAASRRRPAILFVASALYPWAYVAWHLPIVLVLIAESARLLSGRRIRVQPLVAVIAGIGVGVALHPNSMNLLRLTWIQIVDVLLRNAWGAKAGFDLGGEFLPTTAEGWATGLAICVLMTLVGFWLAVRDRRQDDLPLAFALAALAFGVLTGTTNRFVEYFAPCAVLCLALAARPLSWRYLPQGLLAAALVYTVSLNYGYLRAMTQSPDCMPPSAAAFLRQQIPVGAQVFTPGWGSTGTLMLALPDRRFIVALDPTFFYVRDPELYRLWYRISHEGVPHAADLIRQRFGARYVVCFYPQKILPQEVTPLQAQLSAEPGVRSYSIDGLWLLFDLGDRPRTDSP